MRKVVEAMKEAGEDVSVVAAFVLGESEVLDAVSGRQAVDTLLLNAVAFGYTLAVSGLVKREPSAQVLAKAVYTAAECARIDALKLLLKARAATDYCGEVSHPSHFFLAIQAFRTHETN